MPLRVVSLQSAVAGRHQHHIVGEHWLAEIAAGRDAVKSAGIAPFVEEASSGFGQLKFISHSAKLSKTPAFWARPAMPLGSHAPQWPARP